MNLFLQNFGFDQFYLSQFEDMEQILRVGRVVSVQRDLCTVMTALGEKRAGVRGKLRFAASSSLDFPAVGDWVVLTVLNAEQAVIESIFTRKSVFTRREPGGLDEQVIAANVDVVLIATALNQDFNLRRIERYLAAVASSGAAATLLLTKADVASDLETQLAKVRAIAGEAQVFAISSLSGRGIVEFRAHLRAQKTYALVGSSGIGKSTLTNLLMEENLQSVNDIRESDGRGRHTTTSRHLFLLPNGSLLMDTPGMREFSLAKSEDDDSLGDSFRDIEALFVQCRFKDCQHQHEPGCAVHMALQERELDEDRYASYLKLKRELSFQERKHNKALHSAEKQKWKKLNQNMRKRKQLFGK